MGKRTTDRRSVPGKCSAGGLEAPEGLKVEGAGREITSGASFGSWRVEVLVDEWQEEGGGRLFRILVVVVVNVGETARGR